MTTDATTAALRLSEGLGPRWWDCATHGRAQANAWGCPECVRDLRTERDGLLQMLRDKMDENLRLRDEIASLLSSVADNLGDMPVSDEWAAKTAQRAIALLERNDYFRVA